MLKAEDPKEKRTNQHLIYTLQPMAKDMLAACFPFYLRAYLGDKMYIGRVKHWFGRLCIPNNQENKN
jgi:hypothetical protein